MQLTLIRHLPTEWNKQTLLQGRKDIDISPVTLEYEKQIAKNKQTLKSQSPFNLVLASTLKRTHQTAQLYGYQPEIEELLDELDFGPFEGQPKQLLLDTYNEQWTEDPQSIVLGESILHLEKRIKTFLEKYQGVNNILVFGHGSWMRGLCSLYKFGYINGMNKVDVLNNEVIIMDLSKFLTLDGGLQHVRNTNL